MSTKTQQLIGTVNGVDVEKLGATIAAVSGEPALAEFTFRLENSWIDGGKNRSTIGDFYGVGAEQSPRVTPFLASADEPEVLLGEDTAPNPVEWLLHALAACMTTTMAYHAAAKGIRIEEVTSRFEGDLNLMGFLGLDPEVPKGYQGIRVAFRVKADVDDASLSEVLKLTSFSPVMDTITRAVPVSVRLER